VLARLGDLKDFGCSILVGVFAQGRFPVSSEASLFGPVAANVAAAINGAAIFRVHDIAETYRALTFDAIRKNPH
jgi:dihydropteroate synthase